MAQTQACTLPRPKKKTGRAFTRRCASLVKEQRAKIYILRRCATMLLCWFVAAKVAIYYWIMLTVEKAARA